MNTLQNLHTHSTFCDGKNTPEEMILTAIEMGFGSLGFSGHSYNPYSDYGGFSLEKEQLYKKEILRLKEKYAGKFPIYPFCNIHLNFSFKNKTAEGEPSAVLKMHSENISLDLIGVNTVLLEKHVSNLAVNTFIDFFDRFSDLRLQFCIDQEDNLRFRQDFLQSADEIA